jgi:hypothetical protein
MPHLTERWGCAESQGRTGDTRIFSPLLYQLSYLGKTVLTGFEPAISCVTGMRVKPLRYRTAHAVL